MPPGSADDIPALQEKASAFSLHHLLLAVALGASGGGGLGSFFSGRSELAVMAYQLQEVVKKVDALTEKSADRFTATQWATYEANHEARHEKLDAAVLVLRLKAGKEE